MRGTIRVLLGLLVLFGVAGGLDNASDAELFLLVAMSVVGALLMFSGVRAMNGVR